MDKSNEIQSVQGFSLNIPAEITLPDNSNALGRIVAIGPAGLALETTIEVPIRAEVALSFRLESYPLPIESKAEVLWSGAYDAPGFGLLFTTISDFERSVVMDFVQRKTHEVFE